MSPELGHCGLCSPRRVAKRFYTSTKLKPGVGGFGIIATCDECDKDLRDVGRFEMLEEISREEAVVLLVMGS